MNSNSRVFRSAFTGYTQSQSTPGALWTCSYQYPLLTDENMRVFKAWLTALRGQTNAFPARDFAFVGQADTGITASATLGADTCIFAAAVNLSMGDYITVGNELKLVLYDVVNGTTARVEPPFRKTMTDALVEYNQPSCYMLLDTDSVKWNTTSPVLSSLEFSGTEVFYDPS